MVIGITGSTGGLGKRLTEYLVTHNYQVRALVRRTSRVADLLRWGVELVYGDLNDSTAVADFVQGLDICYHLAAQVGTAKKTQYMRVNVVGTRTLCDALIKYNIQCRMVYCSSIVVKEVNMISKFLLSDYTISKFEAEKVVDRYMDQKGLKATVIYPGYIYGPYDQNFIPTLVKLLKQLKFLIKGGETAAPVVYIDDLCELFYLAGTNPVAIGKKYVSLSNNAIGIHGFLKIVAEQLNYSFPQKTYPKTPLVIAALVLDRVYKLLKIKTAPPLTMRIIGVLSKRARHFNEAAVNDLGWNPQVSIREGIARALAWQQSKN